jgi:hypothetical protein
MGIEASAEIQSAARRVVEENRKLRSILHERGVSDTEIVVAMGGTSDRSYDHISAAPSLNTMLERRITCNGPSCTNSPVSTHSSLSRVNGHPPSVPPLSIPVPRSSALSSNDSPSPHSIVSGMGTPPGYHSSPFYTSPMTPASNIKSENLSPYMPYDQSFNSPWPYPGEPQYLDPTSQYNTSSSIDAANIIQTMRNNDGPQTGSYVDCRAPEQNYYVNNSVVYMDRYGSPPRG